jgi:hypothetical protein
MTPLSGAAVQTLAPHQVARGSTLLSVNQHVATSVSIALMSVILTNQFNRSQNITVAERLGILRGKGGKHGPLVSSPHKVSADFTMRLMHDLAHAYTIVIVVGVAVVALALLPVAFLPKRPPSAAKRETPVPVF